MPRENVELARKIHERWARGDFTDASWADAGLEFTDGQDQTVYGTDAMAAAWRDWLRTWEDFKVVPEEYVEHGDEVLVLTSFRGRGKGSGVPAAFPGACRFRIRGGKVTRLILYATRDDALESFGRN